MTDNAVLIYFSTKNQPSKKPSYPSAFTGINPLHFKQEFLLLFFHNSNGTPEFTNCGILVGTYDGNLKRANMEQSMDLRKANTESSQDLRRANTKSYWKQNVNLSKRVRKDSVFLGLQGLLLGIFLMFCPLGNPLEQPYQPLENPVHPSSFTQINPI